MGDGRSDKEEQRDEGGERWKGGDRGEEKARETEWGGPQ